MDGNGINLCSVYPANNPYIYALLPNVYVGIVGWIYVQNKDWITFPSFIPILVSLLFEQ